MVALGESERPGVAPNGDCALAPHSVARVTARVRWAGRWSRLQLRRPPGYETLGAGLAGAGCWVSFHRPMTLPPLLLNSRAGRRLAHGAGLSASLSGGAGG